MANPETTPTVIVKWGPTEDLPVSMVDQLHWRTISDRAYLTFGQMNLPLGEERLSIIPVRPVARFVVTPQMLHMFAKIFAEAAAQFPEVKPIESK
jgi:hypothetical protein